LRLLSRFCGPPMGRSFEGFWKSDMKRISLRDLTVPGPTWALEDPLSKFIWYK